MAQGELTYLLDESMGRPLANVLQSIRAPGTPRIMDARDVGLSGIDDDEVMRRARQKDFDVIVWADSRVLNASIRRNAWRDTGLTLFVLHARWSDLKLFEQARNFIWWWPEIVARSEEGPSGAAWKVPIEFRPGGFARLFPEVA